LPGLDLSLVTDWFDAELPGTRCGPLRASLLEGGKSNLTYLIDDGQTSWALRRPPLGHVLPTAHDMAREYRVIAALGAAGYPVPRPIALCAGDGVLGAPFYLMAFVPGVVFDDAPALAVLGFEQAQHVSDCLVRTLAQLHAIDPERVGLADFGRPDGFLQRQVRRWTQQWHSSVTRPVPAIDEVIARLTERIPESLRVSVLHGDYRLTNVRFSSDLQGIAAVVDWEMATIGDPLTDLGMLYTYHELSERSDAIMPVLSAADGFLVPDEILDSYTSLTEADLSQIAWYIAFGYFKLAVISEGIAARHLKGETVGDGFSQFHDLVPQLVDQARAHMSALV
jgi:aminoglycoside phosphotransferase (APT) family kinase protein